MYFVGQTGSGKTQYKIYILGIFNSLKPLKNIFP